MGRYSYFQNLTARFIVAIAVIFIASCALADVPTTAPASAPVASFVTTRPSDGNFKAHAVWNIQCAERVGAMMGKACDVIFIGDSITANFIELPTKSWGSVGRAVWDKHYSNLNVLNFGVGADGTEHMLWRMDNMDIRGFKPKVVVILAGTNDTRSSPEEIAAGVKAVVEKTEAFYPAAKIILLSILPNARATQKMADANTIIQTFGDDKTVFYFDLAAKMPREGNNWQGLGSDRLHLTPAGYEIWAKEMDPLLKRLMSAAQ